MAKIENSNKFELLRNSEGSTKILSLLTGNNLNNNCETGMSNMPVTDDANNLSKPDSGSSLKSIAYFIYKYDTECKSDWCLFNEVKAIFLKFVFLFKLRYVFYIIYLLWPGSYKTKKK